MNDQGTIDGTMPAEEWRRPRVEVIEDRKVQGRTSWLLRRIASGIALVGGTMLLGSGLWKVCLWFMLPEDYPGENLLSCSAEYLRNQADVFDERIEWMAIPEGAKATSTVPLPMGESIEMGWYPPGLTDGTRKLTRGFWMSVEPVTQAQWESVMENNPSETKAWNKPVDRVSWEECRAFCEKAGSGLRLPTRLEMEMALEKPWRSPYAEWCADWYGEDNRVLDAAGPEAGEERVVLVPNGVWYGGCLYRVATVCHAPPHARSIEMELELAYPDSGLLSIASKMADSGMEEEEGESFPSRTTESRNIRFRVCRFGELPPMADKANVSGWGWWLARKEEIRMWAYVVLLVLWKTGYVVLACWFGWKLAWAGGKHLLARRRRVPSRKGLLSLPGGAKMTMVWCFPEMLQVALAETDPFWHDFPAARWNTGFWIGESPVDTLEWESVMGAVVWKSEKQAHVCPQPIEVRREECLEFCRKAGPGVRLASSGQWCIGMLCGMDAVRDGWMEWCSDRLEGKGGMQVVAPSDVPFEGVGEKGVYFWTKVPPWSVSCQMPEKDASSDGGVLLRAFRICCPGEDAPLDGFWGEDEVAVAQNVS